MVRQIVVDRVIEREVYLHNVLEDMLIGIDERFNALTHPELKPGWKSEALNGAIILAMLNEGWINAIGQKAIPGWDPTKSAEDRLKEARMAFLSDLQFNKSPLQSVNRVRQIRNSFAHAKPLIENRTDYAVVVEDGDHRTIFQELDHPIESEITVESYRHFREDSETFRHLLLDRSGLKVWDIKTKVQEQSTFIREAD